VRGVGRTIPEAIIKAVHSIIDKMGLDIDINIDIDTGRGLPHRRDPSSSPDMGFDINIGFTYKQH
jgi:hypothetical protein